MTTVKRKRDNYYKYRIIRCNPTDRTSTYAAGLQGEEQQEEEVLIEADSVTQILSEGENVIREYTTPESVIYNCVNMAVKEA